MKRIGLTFLLLLAARSVFAFTPPGSHPGTYVCGTGLSDDAVLNDCQAAVDDAALITGDTIQIDATGTQIFNDSLNIGITGNSVGKNITLQAKGKDGYAGGTRIVAGNTPGVLDFHVNDLNTPFVVRDIQFYGEVPRLTRISGGVSTVRQVSGVWKGGIIFYNARWSSQTDHTFNDGAITGGTTLTSATAQFVPDDAGTRTITGPGIPAGTKIATYISKTQVTLSQTATNATGLTFSVLARTAGGTLGTHIVISGCYAEGIFFHSEFDDNPVRETAETAEINMSINPNTGTGQWGDYVQSQPSPTGDLAGTMHAIFFEDMVLKHTGGVNDTGGGVVNNGGCVFVGRHCTQIPGIFVTHGFGETGKGSFAARLQELYNNLYCWDGINGGVPWGKSDYSGAEGRSSQQLVYNNYSSIVAASAGAVTSVKKQYSGVSYYRGSYIADDRIYNGPDALNPLDENWKGDAQDMPYRINDAAAVPLPAPLTFRHYLDANYNPAPVNLPSINNATHTDSVNAGVDSDPRFGDVYGHAAISGVTATQTTISGVSIQGTFPTPADVTASKTDDFWRGFVIRNPSVDRGFVPSGQAGTPFTYIEHSHFNGSTTDLVVEPNQQGAGSGKGPVNVTSGSLELRRVKTYFGAPGAGALANQITDNSNPLTYNGISGLNPRWVGQLAAGVWYWGNMWRQCTARTGGTVGAWTVESFPVREAGGGEVELYTREFHQIRAAGDTINSAQTKPGYGWDKTTTGTPANMVGADYTVTFSDGVSNTGNWASFSRNGSSPGAAPYPNPLRAQIVAPGDSISVSGPGTVTGGSAATFTVTNANANASSITVSYTFGAGGGDTAVAGTDYTAPSGSVVIPANSNSASVAVSTIARPGVSDKIATFHITSVSIGSIGASNAAVTITNPVSVSVSVSPNFVSEGNSATFTLTANANVSANTTVAFTMGGTAISGTNYTLSGTSVIASGTSTKAITINTINAFLGDNVSAIMNLSAGAGYVLGSPPSATLTIKPHAVVIPAAPAEIQVR